MSGTIRIGGSIVGVVLLATTIHAPAQQNQGEGGESEIQRGYQIAPVPLSLQGKNRSLVGLGGYLVNGPMDCVGCHSANSFLPGGDPFLGQPTMINPATHMAGGVAFGPFVSRNLTPDSFGLPGGLTFEDFVQVMRTGADLKAIPPHVPDNPGLLQVMPWPAYRHSTDRTLRAIYEYLTAIPCVEGGPGQPANRCGP